MKGNNSFWMALSLFVSLAIIGVSLSIEVLIQISPSVSSFIRWNDVLISCILAVPIATACMGLRYLLKSWYWKRQEMKG